MKTSFTLIGLFLSSFLFSQILTVDPDSFVSIGPGSSITLDGLEIAPDDTYVISGANDISRTATDHTTEGSSSVSRVYNSSALLTDFTGTLTFSYFDEELNNLSVTISNGDFNSTSTNWRFETFTGGTTSYAFYGSSDGSFKNYDGTDNGGKTRGAKWNKVISAGAYLSSNTRYAYQPIIVSPTLPDRTVKYILEYEYAIKTPEESIGIAPGGNRIISEVLNAHFSDGADAVLSEPVSQFIASEVNGKRSFTTVKQEFTTNSTGEMAIMFYAVSDVDLYLDNVKVYPVEESDLVLNLQAGDDSWTSYHGPVNEINNTVSYTFNDAVSFKAVTASSPTGGILTIEDINSTVNSIVVYPNPTTDYICIKADRILKAELYDLMGRKVRTTNQSQIDMSSLSSGNYILQLIREDKTQSFKIIKQ